MSYYLCYSSKLGESKNDAQRISASSPEEAAGVYHEISYDFITPAEVLEVHVCEDGTDKFETFLSEVQVMSNKTTKLL